MNKLMGRGCEIMKLIQDDDLAYTPRVSISNRFSAFSNQSISSRSTELLDFNKSVKLPLL